MRVLGVDLGSKRIGLAVGETDYHIATPRPYLPATGTLQKDAQALVELAKRESATLIVIGYPINPEGSDRMERICRNLADRIETLGLPAVLVNEAQTSLEAEASLYSQGLNASQRDERRDSEAACLILERYFDETAR